MGFLNSDSTSYYKTLWAPERTRYIVAQPDTPFYVKVMGHDLSFREAIGEVAALARETMSKKLPYLVTQIHKSHANHRTFHSDSYHLQEIGTLDEGSVVIDMNASYPGNDDDASIERYDSKPYRWVSTCDQRIVYSSILVPADALIRKDEYILI